MTYVWAEEQIYDKKTNKFTSCRYPLTFKIETKFHCIKVTNAWDYSERCLVIIYLQAAGQARICCEHCSVCRVMRLMRHIAGLMTRVRSDMGAIYTALLHYSDLQQDLQQNREEIELATRFILQFI